MLIDYKSAGPGDFQKQLDFMYELLAELSKRTKAPLHMEALTRNIIAFPGDCEYPIGRFGHSFGIAFKFCIIYDLQILDVVLFKKILSKVLVQGRGYEHCVPFLRRVL